MQVLDCRCHVNAHNSFKIKKRFKHWQKLCFLTLQEALLLCFVGSTTTERKATFAHTAKCITQKRKTCAICWPTCAQQIRTVD